MAFGAGFIGADAHVFGIGKINQFLLDIHGNINEDGAGPAGARDIERFFKNAPDLGRVLDEVAVLDEGFNSAGDVHFLENVTSQQFGRNLPSDDDKGYRIHVRCGNACNQISGTGTGGYDTDAGFPSHSGVTIGGVPRILLSADQDMANIRLAEGIIKGTNGSSWITEDDLYALPLQTFNDCLTHANHV